MNLQQLEQSYLNLANQLKAGQITQQQFSAAIGPLRFQDEAGTWWQLREDGAWLRWDGKVWLDSGRIVAGQTAATAAVVNEVTQGMVKDAAEFTKKLTFKKFLHFLRKRILWQRNYVILPKHFV